MREIRSYGSMRVTASNGRPYREQSVKVLGAWKGRTRTMTTERKVIRAKLGLLELAKQLGNVSQACRVMGYSHDSFIDSRNSTIKAARPHCRRSRGANRC
jgi:hypothetical protein